MHLKLHQRLARLSIIVPVLALAGCFGEGDGKERILGTPKPPVVGVLLDSPVAGVDWQTTANASGVTNADGEFEYQPGDRISFSIGGIALGTVPAAPVITAVELTGSNDPTDRAALNMLVFLQSIDADSDPSNGITVSDGTRSNAQSATLDFTAADFSRRVATVVDAIASGNTVVSETDALLHFYDTYLAFGGTDTFNFLFPGFPPVGGGVGFELVFSDEFNTDGAPSPEKWNYETGYGDNGWGNNEWQLYTDSPDNVRVEDGNLVISALCPTPPCGVRDGTVTSARITTQDKFEFRYGKVLARIKPPVGDGAWPAFWSLGANFPEIGWPRSGEIDFMEMHNAFSDDRTTHFTVHWCDQTIQAPLTCSFPEGWIFDSQQTSFTTSLGDDFHVFEADWDENRIIGKIDGIEYFRKDIDAATMEEFQREFFLILNVAMGGTLGSDNQPPNGSEVFPQTMLVDYVRVFQRVGGDTPTDFSIDFENAPESYDFGVDGGFGGGAAAVVANPVPGGINSSAQVARMLKFAGEVFAGSLLSLDSPLEVVAGTSFTMKVYSPRPVTVTLKLEGGEDIERTVNHSGTGWEEIEFDFGSYADTLEGLTFIFDLGTPGDAGGDPDNWTFYFDDIVMVPPEPGGPDLAQIDLPITFEDPAVDYTVIDFGEPVPVSTTLVVDPVDADNIAASSTKPPGAPVWAGTTMSTEAGLATPIPFTATQTTIGVRVYSPDVGIPVRLKAENAADSAVSVEAEVLTTAAGRWQTLVFDFANVVEGPALDLDATYDLLSIFFNFGTDGDTAGEKTYLWDDVRFGVPVPVVDTTPPTLDSVTIATDNSSNSAFGVVGNDVILTFTASEPIMRPTVTIGGVAADTITGAGANWEARREITDSDSDGMVTFTIAYSDLAGNPGMVESNTSDDSMVTLDFLPPAVTIVGAPASFTSLAEIDLSFQFTEAVSGFTLSDINVTNGIARAFGIVDAARYTAEIVPDGGGDLVIGVGAGAALDLAGNPSLPAMPATVVDELPMDEPRLTSVRIFSDNDDPAFAVAGDLVTLEITANEDIVAPTVTIAGEPAGTVTGDATMWTATREMQRGDAEGEIEFAIEFEDLDGNAGPRTDIAVGTGTSVTFDITRPTLTISMPATIDTLEDFDVDFMFDEDVIGFEAGDVAVSNGSLSAFSSSDSANYTAMVTPDGAGDVTITVGDATATDRAGNPIRETMQTGTLNLVPFWDLVWADEFPGAMLNPSIWTARSDGGCPSPCDGEQSYDPAQVSVAGGVLMLQARDDGGSPAYISGLVDTRGKREFRHGRIEIEARIPGTTGTEAQLWMVPADEDVYGPWPLSGEVEIVNAPNLGAGGTMLEHALRYGLPESEDTDAAALSSAPSTAGTAFSTYALEWEGGEFRWFVDGTHVATQIDENWYTYHEDLDGVYTVGEGAAPFDENFALVLSMAVTEAGGTGYPHTLEIRSVRVYRCANPVDADADTGCAGLIDAVDPGITPVVATPAPYNGAPYTETLEVYTDAPAVVDFVEPGGGTTTAALEPATFSSDSGVTVVSNTGVADGTNTVWNVNVAAPAGSGGVLMGAGDFGATTGFFDLSGGETAGEVLFRLRVNSVSGDPQLAVRLDSDTGSGQQTVPYTADGAWSRHSIKIADLVSDSVMGASALNLANLNDLFIIEASGGSIDFDLDDISARVACRDIGRCEATARLSVPVFDEVYGQDFETLDIMSPTALSDDNWQVFVNVFRPDGIRYIRGYGPDPAPNGGPGFSAIVNDQGGADQGTQQLSIYSDYNNVADQTAGNQLEANVFQEFTIGSGSGEVDIVGQTLYFSFDAKRGNINDPSAEACMDPSNDCNSTAVAFIKTIDPATGFSLTNFVPLEMTDVPDTWGRYSISLPIDAGLEGQLLQVGFYAKAGDFEPSGVFYDNLVIESGATAAP